MGVRCRTVAVAAALLVLLCGSTSADASVVCPNETLQPTPDTAAQAAAALVCDINVIRARRDLRPLRWSDDLAGAAQAFAQDLAAQRSLSHISTDGRTANDRIFATGYFDGFAARLVLENVAWGNNAYSTPLATALGWMDSTAHRANLLDPQAADIGVGIAPGQMPNLGASGFFYVADFAARGNTASASRSTLRPRACRASKRRSVYRKRHRVAHRKRCRAAARV